MTMVLYPLAVIESSFLLDNKYPVLLFAIYSCVYLTVLALVYRTMKKHPQRYVRPLLTGLRVLTVLFVLFFLLNPSVTREKPYSSTEEIVLMLDTSRSMSIKDEAGGIARSERMRDVLDDGKMTKRLEEVLPVSRYKFDAGPTRLSSGADLKPEGDSTHLLESLVKTSTGSGGRSPRAVVLMTDGADTSDDNFLDAIRDLNRKDVAVFPVGFGSDKPRKDIAISRIKVSRNVARNTEANVDIYIDQYGYDGKLLSLKLMKGDKIVESAGDVLDAATKKITLKFTPKVEGLHTYTVVAEAQKGEAFTENNRQTFSVNAVKTKLRILYMEGTMYRIQSRELWEFQYLEQAVLETPDMEIKTLFRDPSREAYMAGVSWVQDPVNGFPTRKRDLFKYDIIICSDVDMIFFTEQQLEWIVEFVEKHGGGFIMIGGWTSFGSGGYDETVVDKMLPVDMQGRADMYFEGASFKMNVTPEGRKHPIFQISEEDNDAVLDAMPYFRGCNRVQRKKPAAVTLAAHPSYETAFGPMPLIAVQEYGRGRSMAFVSDTTAGWGEMFESDWGEEGDNRHYRRFWQNTFRWLGQSRLSRPSKYIVVETEKASYGTDEEITLVVEINDENYEPTAEAKTDVRVIAPDGTRTSVNLVHNRAGKYAGKYTGAFQPDQTGRYEVDVSASLEGTHLDTDVIQVNVTRPNVEFKDYVRDDGLLERLARFTGGRVVSPDDAHELPEIIAETRGIAKKSISETRSIWDKWPFLVWLFAVLTIEWVMRKRSGLA